MANKRYLKQYINCICDELLAHTIAVGMLEKNIENQDVDNLLRAIVEFNSDYIRRVSHPEPGMKPKVFYKAVKESFSTTVEETLDAIEGLY